MSELIAGQRHEAPRPILLLEAGLHRLWPGNVAIAAGIPEWLDERCGRAPLIHRLKCFRAMTTRYDKQESSYHPVATIACVLECLRLCR